MIKYSLIMLLLLPLSSFSQVKEVDSTAIYLLDHMTHTISNLESCSYKLTTSVDEDHYPYGMVTLSSSQNVHIVGPDKMQVDSKGDKTHKGYWYNGEHFAYFSYAENNYSIIEAPSDILTTIDSLNTVYELEFPAADFLYPAFTDDLLEAFEVVKLLGNNTIDSEDCFHIIATNTKMNLQIWLSNDAFLLPKKFIITYKDKSGYPQFEATFSDWKLNPNLPDSMFDFVPPPGAKEIYIVPKNELVSPSK